MKKITLLLSAFVIMLSAFAQKVDRTKAPKAGPAPKIQIGEYKLFTLENGLKVIVVENHKLPRVSYSINLDIDPVLEGEKAGYVSIAGDVLGAGTEKRSKAKIDEETDFIGASLSTSPNGVFASCLSKHSDALLDLMSDVLLHPTFPAEEIDKVVKKSISGLANEKTDPNAISEKIGNMVKYGKDHPYGEFQTEESLGALTRNDIVGYYNTFFKPNVAYLIVVGDITPELAKTQAEKYFGSWKRGNVNDLRYKTPAAPAGNRVVFVPVPGAVQSVIDITYPIDLKPGTMDAITANVLNNVLGGSGFQTRLMQNLREDKAYTYGAFSSISADDVVGSFSAGASVRNDVTDSSIVQFLYEMRTLMNELVSDSTLTTVKNIMTGSFARSLERPQTIANFAFNIEKYGLAKDYYETYLQKLNGVTSQDLKSSALKWIKPGGSYITVVGNKEVAPKLAQFAKSGEVEMYNPDGTIFKELKPAPADVTVQTVLRNYINAIGGEKKLKKVKSFEQKGSMAYGPMNLDMNIKMKGQKKLAMVMTMSGQEAMRQVYNGSKMTIVQMGQKVDGDADAILEAQQQSDLLTELHYEKYGITPSLKGIDKVNGKEYYVVELQKKNGTTTDYYDVLTGLKTISRSVTLTEDGQTVNAETTIESYLTTKTGLKFPSKISQVAQGQQFGIVVNDLIINPKLKDEDFEVK